MVEKLALRIFCAISDYKIFIINVLIDNKQGHPCV